MVIRPSPHFVRRLVGVLARHGLHVDEPGPRLHLAGQQREVLAQREALELAGQVDVAQVGVADEREAVHLPRLALVPVGAGEEVDDRLHLGILG